MLTQTNQPREQAGGRYAAGLFLRLPARRQVLPHSWVKLEPDMVNEWLTTEGWNCRNGWPLDSTPVWVL